MSGILDKAFRSVAIATTLVAVFSGAAVAQAPPTTQTIVFVRHGEKPSNGLGQLSCRGLNRALALPGMIEKKFGKPVAIFAPDPSQRKKDSGTYYDYVRPLATIEPTAIANGLPIGADYGFTQTGKIRKALENPAFADALVVVAWEHTLIEDIVRKLMSAHGGDKSVVPTWDGMDFDGIYVVTITRNGGTSAIAFARDTQGLDGQSDTCPK